MPILFSEEEREKLRIQMLEVGFELIKQHGTIHASVEKVTKAVGIGRTTFYNFFPTKEAFLLEIIKHQREKGQKYFILLLNGREKMTTEEGQKYIRYLMTGEDTIYRYTSANDMEDIQQNIKDAFKPNLAHETEVIREIVSHIEGVKDNLDYALIANIMKTLAIVQGEKAIYHPEGYEATVNAVLELLFYQIFK
ncbi:MAG: TetR/AcrR family transcriptional regulator [Roseburia sp.]